MKGLLCLYSRKALREKLIYFFLFGVGCAAYAYAFLLSSPEMEEMLNVNIALVSNSHFPEFLLRFIQGIVGPFFFAFITNIFINEELSDGMFYEPLLHCKKRQEILNAKICILCFLCIFIILGVYVIGYTTAWIRWGNSVFQLSDLLQTFEKYLLATGALLALELGLILVSLYTRSTMLTISISILYVLFDLFLNQYAPKAIAGFWFGYYPYYGVFIKEFSAISVHTFLIGIMLSVGYGTIFYYLTRKQINKMDF